MLFYMLFNKCGINYFTIMNDFRLTCNNVSKLFDVNLDFVNVCLQNEECALNFKEERG